MKNTNLKIDASCDLSNSERSIMAEVLSAGSIARSGLPSLTGLTQQAVHKLCDALIQRGYLKLGTPEIAGRGKPSPRLSVNPDHYVSAGISISTDSVRYCLLDLAGNPLIEETESIATSEPDSVTQQLADRLATWSSEIISGRTSVGLGVGMQGFRSGREDVFYPPEPLSSWTDIPIKELFEKRCKLSVFTDNNASVCAVAENYLGGAERNKCSVFLSFNYGFGAGISWLNKPFHGGHGNAGEISALFSRDELPDRPALGELLKCLQANGVPVKNIRDMASEFDINWPGLSDWLDQIRPTMQSAIRALQATIDPEIVFFGGEAPSELRALLVEISKDAFHDPRLPAPRLMPSKLDGDPAHLGAALLPLHRLIF